MEEERVVVSTIEDKECYEEVSEKGKSRKREGREGRAR